MGIKLPELQKSVPIIEDGDKPSFAFHVWWSRVVKAITTAFNQLETMVLDIQAAIDAAAAAEAAAVVAQAAADDAQTAADGSNAVASLTSSGVTGCTITATDAGADASVSISSHTRVYGDGSTVAVTGATLTGLAYSTYYYIYYDDPSRAGGAVTYVATTTESTAVQAGARHLVGAVTTPAALGADEDGTRVQPPGVGNLQAQ